MHYTPDNRNTIFPETELPKGKDILAQGRKAVANWPLGRGQFQHYHGVANEIEYKRNAMKEGRVMQHAHLGFRDLTHTIDATTNIYETCAKQGARIDRFGMCLDWSMGYLRSKRKDTMRGTGILLNAPEDFLRLTNAAPAAMHFGDFMLGFPAAFENTCAALAAGATTIGNLGQYFTFRLPGHDDDIEATASTVKALGLIAAQSIPVLVHSNLDDGFAAVFKDVSSAIGQAILEKYIISNLIGAPYAVCYGHHFTDPLTRIAFQRALAEISDDTPGSQIYGATVLYKGNIAENYAALSFYLLPDIMAQMLRPTGHAVNPVPVTENIRIPDADEIIDAQCNLSRMSDLAAGHIPLLDIDTIDHTRDRLLRGGQQYADRVMKGLENAGVDVCDPFEMLLALRRIGGRLLEHLYGFNAAQETTGNKPAPWVVSTTYLEIKEHADAFLATDAGGELQDMGARDLTILTATTDVHEHGKVLLDLVFEGAGFTLVNGGVSTDPDSIAALAKSNSVDAIALSTYNGVALNFATALLIELEKEGLKIPILIGGRLNQIPKVSNSSLPLDVTPELIDIGVYPCIDLESAHKALVKALSSNSKSDKIRK